MDKSIDDKIKDSKKGIIGSTLGTAFGAGIYGMSSRSKKLLDKLPKEESEKLIKELGVDNIIKNNKRLGKGLMAAGVPLTGYFIYKHYKYRKDKNKGKNDSNP